MIKLSGFTPLNIQEEKAKFMADQLYNPQFLYSDPIPAAQLTSYGLPKQENQIIAERILQQTAQLYTPDALQISQGKLLADKEVKDTIDTFLQLHHLDQRITVTYSASYLTRTAATPEQLKIRLPMEYRRRSLLGMLYHEIGTHILRRVNYEQQPWFKQKKSYGFSEYLETEEGLATLHSRIPHKYKGAVTQAMHYLAIATAQTGSFVDVWNAIQPYAASPEQCWSFTLRAKRGMADTSQPGGYTKDLVYLDGMISVWRWLRTRDFDITQLYFGKMALADVNKAVQLNPDFVPKLPLFFTKDRAQYQKVMLEIGQVNGLE